MLAGITARDGLLVPCQLLLLLLLLRVLVLLPTC